MKWKNLQSMVLNKVPKDIKPKVKVFLKAVDKHFSFLLEKGYVIKKIEKSERYSVANNIIEVFYKNEKLDRLVIVHYDPGLSSEERKDFIDVSIYKGEDLHFGQLKFDMYLEKYLSATDFDSLNYPRKNNKSSFKENMETSITGYSYFLKDVGENIIDGKEWEDGLRFDWSSAEDILYQAQKDIIYGKKDKDKEDDEDTKDG